MTSAPSGETQTSALSENPASRDKPKIPPTADYAAPGWHDGYLPSFFVSHGDELHAVIQEASAWIESKPGCRKATTSKPRRSCRKHSKFVAIENRRPSDDQRFVSSKPCRSLLLFDRDFAARSLLLWKSLENGREKAPLQLAETHDLNRRHGSRLATIVFPGALPIVAELPESRESGSGSEQVKVMRR